MRKIEIFVIQMNKDWRKGDWPQMSIQKNNSIRGNKKW